jgi:hypothetical protein
MFFLLQKRLNLTPTGHRRISPGAIILFFERKKAHLDCRLCICFFISVACYMFAEHDKGRRSQSQTPLVIRSFTLSYSFVLPSFSHFRRRNEGIGDG